MANKTTSMSNVRQIIKLYSQQMGKKKIGERLGMSKNTVKLYIGQFHRLKTTKEELFKLTDFELNKLFHPPKEVLLNDRLRQLHDFFPIMEKQLRRRGMTVGMQFREFKIKHPENYGETAFYKYYNHWKKKVKPAMHIEQKVGDKKYGEEAGVKEP